MNNSRILPQRGERIILAGALAALLLMPFAPLAVLAEAVAQEQSESAAEKPILLACSTCGCSEVCPLALVDPAQGDPSALSESIWGNLILKIAYQRDPELQKLAKHYGLSNAASVDALTGVAVGTLAQNLSSMATLNPPEGIEDSYGPGIIGLTLDVTTNLIFGARAGASFHYHKKIKQRQLAVRQHVETILNHLEFSKTDCSEAQADLASLIGERASKECLQLWQSSHLAAAPESNPVSYENVSQPAAVADALSPQSGSGTDSDAACNQESALKEASLLKVSRRIAN